MHSAKCSELADRLHAAVADDLDELAVVVLGQPVDRVLAAGEAPKQQAAQRLGMAKRKHDREPRARRRAAHDNRQRVELAREFMEVIGPDLVLGARAVERHVGGAAIAAVVQQHAVALRSKRLRDSTQLCKRAAAPRRQRDPRTGRADHLVVDMNAANEGFSHDIRLRCRGSSCSKLVSGQARADRKRHATAAGRHAPLSTSWPGLSRPSTPYFAAKAWMPATSAGMTPVQVESSARPSPACSGPSR